ncbi:MAG: hypothetical protein V3R77_08815 [Candidatus Binatia bacterium]
MLEARLQGRRFDDIDGRPAGQRARSDERSREIGRRGEQELWALEALGGVMRWEWERFRKAFVFVAARLVNEARQTHGRIASSHRFADVICRGIVRLQIGALGGR